MIQELLGSGGGIIGGERRSSIPFNGAHHHVLEATLPPNSQYSPSPSPSPSNSSSSAAPAASATAINSTTTTTTKSASSAAENLRCPRCDSSNTKFCYYNNYNLTQPRHFCKTCRRYWTKGGALRNVPIGGGCRKNKSPSGVPLSSGAKSTANNKIKTMACEIGRSGFGSGFDHIYELPSSPILWSTPHQNGSHLLSLLRAGASQSPNPSPSLVLSSTSIKEEGGFMGAQALTDPTLGVTGGVLLGPNTGRAIGLDHLGQVPNPMWRTNQQQQPNGGGFMVDDQNSAFQQLYQRLRSSTSGYYPDTSSSSMMVLGNAASSSPPPPTAVLESAPVVGSDHLGFWNPSFSWSDLPTAANGAYRN